MVRCQLRLRMPGPSVVLLSSRSTELIGLGRANWPIQEHWNRVITLASAWSGKNPAIATNWTGNEDILKAAKNGLNWWLERDFTSPDCLSEGGVP